ncbi:MAG: hypothetical protein JOY61_24980 [Chloroflexi bacterium]|nr:hypothetical protein [Chloroflexota bacterium]
MGSALQPVTCCAVRHEVQVAGGGISYEGPIIGRHDTERIRLVFLVWIFGKTLGELVEVKRPKGATGRQVPFSDTEISWPDW